MHVADHGIQYETGLIQVSQEARAHVIESSLSTLRAFLVDESRRPKSELVKDVYRASGRGYADRAHRIAEVQRLVHEQGELTEQQKLQYGHYEPTRLTILAATDQEGGLVSVFYECLATGERGYGVVNLQMTRCLELEVFSTPEELRQAYGEDAVIRAARAVNDHAMVDGITKAYIELRTL